MAPDHAATGRLPHGRYNSASTKAAPEKSSYHPCRDCAKGRFSAPSLPLPRQTASARGRVVTGRRLHSAHHRAAHAARPTNTTTARIIVSLARVSSMTDRPGFVARRTLRHRPLSTTISRISLARRDRPPASPRCGRGSPVRRDRRTCEVTRRRARQTSAGRTPRPALPAHSTVRPATSAPWRSAAPRGRPPAAPAGWSWRRSRPGRQHHCQRLTPLLPDHC